MYNFTAEIYFVHVVSCFLICNLFSLAQRSQSSLFIQLLNFSRTVLVIQELPKTLVLLYELCVNLRFSIDLPDLYFCQQRNRILWELYHNLLLPLSTPKPSDRVSDCSKTNWEKETLVAIMMVIKTNRKLVLYFPMFPR